VDDFDSGLAALLPRLRRFAYGLSRHATDADDLTQATVERALNARVQWQPGTRLDAWVFRIMRNQWIDTARSRQRHERWLAPEIAGANVSTNGAPAIEAAVELRYLMRALSQLPDEQREAVALVSIDGMAYRDAANLLDIPIGTLTSRLIRGRQALLALTEDHNDDR
jgi:RNA polymerase sigma factor (sigma-70 family)